MCVKSESYSSPARCNHKNDRPVRKTFRRRHLSRTAIVLLILLVKPGREAASRFGLTRQCPVCDHRMIGRGEYCGECGSKV